MTLAQIYERTVIDGDCRVWKGATNTTNGLPVAHIGKKFVHVRRFVLESTSGPLEGKVAVCTCETEGCVWEGHLAAWTRRKLSKESAKRTKYGQSIARTLAISKAMQEKSSLDWEKVRQIRASGLSSRKAGKEFGLSQYNAWQILAHRTWKEFGTNPFAGLMA